MEREIPQSADQSPVDKRPIAHGLEELRTVLGDLARVALTSGCEVMKLTREDFQSPTYQKAGYGAMPERYGTSDRYVYTLEYADGTQVIIMGGKFAPARRFAGNPAPNPMADNRESSNFVYTYNWLQVLDTAERSQVDHRVPQQLHPIVPLLDAFKAE
jgi:hypothetical protein